MTGSFYYDYSEDFDKPLTHHDQDDNAQVSAIFQPCEGDEDRKYDEPVITLRPDTPSSHHVRVDKAASRDISPLNYSASEEIKIHAKVKLTEDTDKSNNVEDVDNHNHIGLIATEHPSQSASAAETEPLESPDSRVSVEESEGCVDQTGNSNSDSCRISRAAEEKLASQSSASKGGESSGSQGTECTLESSLPDFASIFSPFDLVGKPPCFRPSSISSKKIAGDDDSSSMASSIHNLGNQRHRRNVAAVRISTTDLHGEPGHIEDGSIHKQELDILSPEPISPARGLKVQNSIPQLMKALPPLPSGVVDGERQDLQSLRQQNDEFDNKQVSNLSELRDTILESKVGHLPQEMPIGSTQVYQGRQSSPAKFKVRVKPSYSPLIGASSVQNAEAEGLVAERQYCSVTQIKPRLKLKLSRSQLGQGRLTPGEGIVRPNRLKQCNSLADLALYSTVGTNGGQSWANSGNSTSECRLERCVLTTSENQHVQSSTETGSPQHSDPFNISYPPSPGGNTSNKQSLSSSNKDTLVQRPSCSLDGHPIEENGLRKKMSLFRLRIAESLTANASKKCKTQQLERNDSHITSITFKGSETDINSIVNNASRSNNKIRPAWMTNRVKRWATDARQALRSYVRRTLDRSSRRGA
jgi:hypothetical protein